MEDLKLMANLAGNLSLSGVMIYLYLKALTQIKEKDDYIVQMNAQLLRAYNKNTQATEKHSIVLTGLTTKLDNYYLSHNERV